MLPGRAGFAFGLTTLALIIGALPTFTELNHRLSISNSGMILGGVSLMALLVGIGLKSYTHLSLVCFLKTPLQRFL